MAFLLKSMGMKLGSKYFQQVMSPILRGGNPMYEEIIDDDEIKPSNGASASAVAKNKKPKSHRRKRPIPLDISDNDARVLIRVRKQAYRLEWEFSLFGLSVGWTAVFGLIPILGDLLKLWTSYQLIRQCDKIDGGLTNAIRGQMAINMMIDFIIGITPVLGTFADALYKANSRNSILLEQILISRGIENLKLAAEANL